jgi:hypothetical protein
MKPTITEKCSLFIPYLKSGEWCMSTKPQTVNILDMLQIALQSQHDLIDLIRKAPTKDERSILKKQLWAFTPSSIAKGGRGVKYVEQHSGLMAFDIDGVQDQISEVFDAIKLIPYTLYCGKSASGNGLWGLFRISDPTKHSLHFDAMDQAFKALGISIDPAPRSVASLRYACYDKDAFINDKAKVFDKLFEAVKTPVSLPKPKGLNTSKSTNNDSDGRELIEKFNSECEAKHIDEILTNFGFNYHSLSGSKYRYTRPGKDVRAGLSVDYHEEKRTLFSFSSEVPGLEEWKKETETAWSCSPMTALLLYGCGGKDKQHWAMAFNYIKSNL